MQAFFAKVFSVVITWLVEKLAKYGIWLYKSEQQKKINQENLEAYKKAVESGDLDEIKKAGEKLINGIKP